MLTIYLQFAPRSYDTIENDNGMDTFLFLCAVLAPAVFALVYYLTYRSIGPKWEDGIFPIDLKASQDNLLEAYISLGGRMILADPNNSREKVRYMNSYFKQYFRENNFDFTLSLKYAYQNPIKVESVAKWLRLKLPYQKRSQVLYFLTGMAHIDGRLIHRELKILEELRQVLEVTVGDFKRILSGYEQRYEREQKENTRTFSKRKSAIRLSCEVLGVSEHASMDEIKKAYRSLVKKHHPDRFATESEAQQEIAKERFVEIQKAYELLLEVKG